MKAVNQTNTNDICWYSALTLATIGALNWGLIGAMDFNAIQYFFGNQSLLTRIIYISVGISSIYFIIQGIRGLLEDDRE